VKGMNGWCGNFRFSNFHFYVVMLTTKTHKEGRGTGQVWNQVSNTSGVLCL
jgi:hypothetical protein